MNRDEHAVLMLKKRLFFSSLGEDFALELCFIIDIFKPINQTMELLENLQTNIWSPVVYVPALIQMIGRMRWNVESVIAIFTNAENFKALKKTASV